MYTQKSLPTDELTGLFTRKAFHQALDDLLSASKGSEAPIAVAFVDIDNFLHINTEYGHTAGDEVLKMIATLLRGIGNENALPVRYGGDEFALLLPEVEREQAFLLLETFRAQVANTPLKVAGDTVLTVSVGLACYPVDGHLKSELMRKADQALYRAKISGRNQVRLAQDEKMVPKTSHYTQTQLERLSKLAAERQVGEAELLREAMDDLLAKYGVNEIERFTV
ncbi:MAG: GGDEF domain-containing protein [Anaerolineae bacterium CG_4_9_14_3_um_filter_57_17]|nr:diguanylate cyclase [bacterium]NCT21845.1 diguanylate cyclase [bacterium]OIO83629.1 MAG: hypothetical protein AUK01_12155 [Anaerolineae bacterium CG2_30_57_67]PJB65479.1 MAG: GGDEF domain-containing protein [Anaerolineae bacterium CG_4_9_14_3_um_filter_57_17]